MYVGISALTCTELSWQICTRSWKSNQLFHTYAVFISAAELPNYVYSCLFLLWSSTATFQNADISRVLSIPWNGCHQPLYQSAFLVKITQRGQIQNLHSSLFIFVPLVFRNIQQLIVLYLCSSKWWMVLKKSVNTIFPYCSFSCQLCTDVLV